MDFEILLDGKLCQVQAQPKKVFKAEPDVGLSAPWFEEYRLFHRHNAREFTKQEYQQVTGKDEFQILDALQEELVQEFYGLS